MGEISERSAVRRLHDRLGLGLGPGDAEAGYDTTVRRLLGPYSEAGAAPAPSLPVLPLVKKPAKGEKPDKEARKAANKAQGCAGSDADWMVA